MEAQELRDQLSTELMDQDNVAGVGIGEDDDGNKVVVVNVNEGEADSVDIPEEHEDDVEVRETGPFYAEIVRSKEPEEIDRTGKHRPVPGGVSVGHVDVTAGTAGFIVEDDDGNQYAGSNNHVYADTNNASEGDTIIQPGSVDGGSGSSDKSGELAGYVPLEDGVTVDFAWATQIAEYELNIAELGTPDGSPVDPAIGDNLIKSGRTTGITEASVEQIGVNVTVNYGDATYQINDCIITGDMSDGGDSGSATLMKDSMEPVGVLFAGSNTATVHNKATNVESETGLTIVTSSQDTPPTANVTLTLEKEETEETGKIVVKVEDTDGSAVGSATVTVSGDANLSGTTDSTGVVSFTDITIGEYTVNASKDGYVGDSTSVSSGDFN